MSSEQPQAAIRVQGVSKCYRSYSRPRDRLLQLFTDRRRLYEELWALQDVDLTVEKGETLGIVGRNGSGKSTLLQLIVGTLTPTAGEVWCDGRISAILELGAGFNPEFTGLENARLNAAIIGMTSAEIESRLPDIVAFSELGDFIHKPVKTYSSGMHIRLAFSVVINMDPSILVIDEALAVGDSRFQRKCYRKLDELRHDGTTILFVTHSTDAVTTHCDRAAFMEQGRIMEVGEPKMVVNHYLESLFERQDGAAPWSDPGTEADAGLPRDELSGNPALDACPHRPWYNDTEYDWGEGAARIFDYLVLDEHGAAVTGALAAGSDVQIRAAVYFHSAQSDLIYGLTIKTVDGTTVFGTNTERLNVAVDPGPAGGIVHVTFRLRLALISAEYFVSLGVVTRRGAGDEAVLHRRYDLFRLNIHDDQHAFGYAALPASVTIAPAAVDAH